MFYNPNVCNLNTDNLVGCSAALNFSAYSNYYYDRGVEGDLVSPALVAPYYARIAQSILKKVSPAAFTPGYCVKNCMFCKLLDSNAVNFDPFCPAAVCEHYGLDLSRCLPAIPDPRISGISVDGLAPEVNTTLDIDTPYDITFSVYGVSNDFPYVGMPLSQSFEGCPRNYSGRGLDAVPTGFNFGLDYTWFKANLDKVVILKADGTRGNVQCATIAPNGGAYERVIVFCGEDLGTPENPPVAIYINGPVRMGNGQFTTNTAMSSVVGSLEVGTVMYYAERIFNTDPNWNLFFTPSQFRRDLCPSGTNQIILTTWTKGTRQTHPSIVTYPSFNVWSSQKAGVTVEMEDGSTITSADTSFLKMADDDNDNYVTICLSTTVPASKITFERGLFFDPRNTMNDRQTAVIQDVLPLYAPYPTLNANSVTTPSATAVPTFAPTSAAPTVEPTPSPSRNRNGLGEEVTAAITIPVVVGSCMAFVIVGLLFVIYRNKYGWTGVPQSSAADDEPAAKPQKQAPAPAATPAPVSEDMSVVTRDAGVEMTTQV